MNIKKHLEKDIYDFLNYELKKNIASIKNKKLKISLDAYKFFIKNESDTRIALDEIHIQQKDILLFSDTIQNLKSLVYLSLVLDVSGRIAVSISYFINLKTLKLVLHPQKHSQENLIILCKGIGYLKNLNELSLRLLSAGLNHKIGSSLSQLLKKLRNLSILSLILSCNGLGNKGLISLAEGLSELKKIKTLVLGFCDTLIDRNGVNAICSSLVTVKDSLSILELSLSKNNILQYIFFNDLSKLQNLSSLDLLFNKNKMTNELKKAFYKNLECLKDMPQLLYLKLLLRNTLMEDQGLVLLSLALAKLKKLKSLCLKLNNNNIGYAGLKILTSITLGELKSLEDLELDLKDNSLVDADIEDLSSDFSSLYMKTLHIELSGKGLSVISKACIESASTNIKNKTILITEKVTI